MQRSRATFSSKSHLSFFCAIPRPFAHLSCPWRIAHLPLFSVTTYYVLVRSCSECFHHQSLFSFCNAKIFQMHLGFACWFRCLIILWSYLHQCDDQSNALEFAVILLTQLACQVLLCTNYASTDQQFVALHLIFSKLRLTKLQGLPTCPSCQPVDLLEVPAGCHM